MLDRSNSSAIAVHSIDHYALNVPSLAEAEHFLSTFGLAVTHADGGLDIRAGDGHRWARMLPSDRKSLAYLSFNCYADDLSALKAQVKAAGASFDVVPPGENTDGFWFKDPDGNLIQVRSGAKTMPDAQSPLTQTGISGGVRGARARSEVARVHPRRLSHVLLFTPDTLGAVDFYEQALGLRLSDKSLDLVAFTHAPHGSDHHLLAFVKSHAKGWHHAAWDVASIDEVGNGAAQMAAAGFKEGWGTGRHVLGSNFFHYVRDPWGSFCEYSAGIDYVPAGMTWPAGDHDPEDSLYQWGPDVPEYFVRNTET